MSLQPTPPGASTFVSGRSVVAALLAIVIVALTLVGALNDLPAALRGSAQALGTLAGVYLGARLQAQDQRHYLSGAANAALENLFALAESIKLLIATSEAFRARIATSTPQTISAFQHTSESVLGSLDNQARMLLTQAEAAAAVWLPFAAGAQNSSLGQRSSPRGGYNG